MEKKSKMAAKYTRKPHNVLPKFNFQFSMTSSLLLSTHLVSTHPYHYWHLFITSYFKLLDKSSTVAEMGDRNHNRHGPKRKERKGKEEYLYSAFLHQGTLKALRRGSHSFTCNCIVDFCQMAPLCVTNLLT